MLNRTAKIVHHAAFINPQEILAIASQCQENNHVTIGERKQLVDITHDPCEAPLLREQHGECHLSEKPTATEIRSITPSTLLVITVHQDVLINGTCGIKPRKLTGIFLVMFHNCSLFVNHKLYENFELEFHHPTILPLQPIKIKPLQIDRHVDISEVQDSNTRNRQYLEEVHRKHQLGFASLSIAIILITAFLSFIAIKYRRIINSGHCSGQAILKGDVVNHGPSPCAHAVIRGSSPCTCTEPTRSALVQTDDMGHPENVSNTSGTTGPTSLGARLAVLGKQAGQLGL